MSWPSNEAAMVRKERNMLEPLEQRGEKQKVRSNGSSGSDPVGPCQLQQRIEISVYVQWKPLKNLGYDLR